MAGAGKVHSPGVDAAAVVVAGLISELLIVGHCLEHGAGDHRCDDRREQPPPRRAWQRARGGQLDGRRDGQLRGARVPKTFGTTVAVQSPTEYWAQQLSS